MSAPLHTLSTPRYPFAMFYGVYHCGPKNVPNHASAPTRMGNGHRWQVY